MPQQSCMMYKYLEMFMNVVYAMISDLGKNLWNIMHKNCLTISRKKM